ncbi:MAG: type II secretion system GspH family protein [Planctomycetes bacterium]|nr:type II secretion system GspH family protein [Planctomycetota bacterium]
MKHRPPTITRSSLRRLPAFTVVELLVVFVIIIILFSAVLVAGTSLLNRNKIRNTEAVIQVLCDVVQEFERENPSIISAKQQAGAANPVFYRKRYGPYPPDETELFTNRGLPGAGVNRSLAVGGGQFIPAPAAVNYPAMMFYTGGNPAPQFEHRDIAAMILAVRMYTSSAAALLDRIPDSNWSPGSLDATGQPNQFLDRDNNNVWNEDEDEQVPYVVDSWGMPFGYFAQRDYDPDNPTVTESANAPDWNQASTEMIRLNGGLPIIVSYGPNGKEQLTKEVQESSPTTSLPGDWADGQRIDNIYNADNVYASEALKERLTAGKASLGP